MREGKNVQIMKLCLHSYYIPFASKISKNTTLKRFDLDIFNIQRPDHRFIPNNKSLRQRLFQFSQESLYVCHRIVTMQGNTNTPRMIHGMNLFTV